MNDQRMVDVGLLEEAIQTMHDLCTNARYVNHMNTMEKKLRDIISGPGVEPVAPFAYTYEEDGETYFAHPQGHVPPDAKPLYLAAPSAPVQAVPDGWIMVSAVSLPERYAPVLVTTEDGVVKETNGALVWQLWFASQEGGERCYFTHWMPRPQPPKEIGE